ncbi:Glutamyl-tRNA(Gln) amidotransferase subunit F, mitochondrial [Sphaceloma murrayae]|uniref:Glutamyl-tRNA(Gln) amidotransferase subunit F, mitochondrial n=1 Tax=Sphaceloma murrayae TaxID=2082308 RepID=A0A2K1QKN0_9PEZI|nr:Glutamyl-tRNA(Gln) amidotransferase subunit F, mitochondrial [Sphaceloma murrayae]
MEAIQPATRALRASLWRTHHRPRPLLASSRSFTTKPSPPPPSSLRHADTTVPPRQIDVHALLSTPSWDPSTLLPPPNAPLPSELTSAKLHHLLRLSALPPPKDKVEEASMLSTLAQQLHFVKQIQDIDTAGVEPLKAIRDETPSAEREGTIGRETGEIAAALAKEEVRGRYAPRRRRRKDEVGKKAGDWDVLANAARREGRYFIVEKV